jgi:hypothetical protein
MESREIVINWSQISRWAGVLEFWLTAICLAFVTFVAFV